MAELLRLRYGIAQSKAQLHMLAVVVVAVGLFAAPCQAQVGTTAARDSARDQWLKSATTITTKHYILTTDLPAEFHHTVQRHLDCYFHAVNEIFSHLDVSSIASLDRCHFWFFFHHSSYRACFDLPRGDQVLAAYIGTTGMAHGLETVLEAAHACRHEDTLHFAIMGEGARREALEQRAAELELDNLTFLDRVSHDQVPQFLAAIDIPIIHLKPDPVFRTVIPSKLFEFMAMRKPVLMAVEGEGAEIVERTKCGVCTESGNVDQMASEILKLARSPQRRGELGQNGYRAALWHYRREIKADEALQSLQLACSEPTESQSKAAVSHPASKAA